jgi:hypothetical protein
MEKRLLRDHSMTAILHSETNPAPQNAFNRQTIGKLTMKKLLLLAALLGFAGSVFAQGTIAFANTGNNAFRLWTNNWQGTASNVLGSPAIGVRIRIGLYGSTDGSSLQLIAYTTNGAGGFFSAGSPYILPNGYPEGALLTYQIRAWSFAGGFSYEEALLAAAVDPLNIALAQSAIGTTTLGGGTVIQGPLFATSGTQLRQGFEIRNVPEPSSTALGLLGLGAIAMFRRKK